MLIYRIAGTLLAMFGFAVEATLLFMLISPTEGLVEAVARIGLPLVLVAGGIGIISIVAGLWFSATPDTVLRSSRGAGGGGKRHSSSRAH